MADSGSQAPDPSDHGLPRSDTPSALDERDQRILAFERQWWKLEGTKEQAIRDEFGFSPTRYYQLLNQIIDRPEALAFDPMTVKRSAGGAANANGSVSPANWGFSCSPAGLSCGRAAADAGVRCRTLGQGWGASGFGHTSSVQSTEWKAVYVSSPIDDTERQGRAGSHPRHAGPRSVRVRLRWDARADRA